MDENKLKEIVSTIDEYNNFKKNINLEALKEEIEYLKRECKKETSKPLYLYGFRTAYYDLRKKLERKRTYYQESIGKLVGLEKNIIMH